MGAEPAAKNDVQMSLNINVNASFWGTTINLPEASTPCHQSVPISQFAG